MEIRICSKCKKGLPLTFDYFYRSKREKDGFIYSCKKCESKRCKEYKKTEQAKITRRKWEKEYRQSSHGCKMKQKGRLKYNYDITLEQYDAMFEAQDGNCIICGLPQLMKRLAVDHNHQTGEIRGLLCTNCNLLLGRIENNLGLVNKIMEYLRKFARNLTLL